NQNKPWYKKTWGIALLVLSVVTLTFPIPLVIIMWQKDKFHIAVRLAITAIVGMIYISAIGSYNETPQTHDEKVVDSSQQANKQQQEQIKQKEKKEKIAAEYQKMVDTLAPIYCA